MPNEKRKPPYWTCNLCAETVQIPTKSEARAAFKALLKCVGRLPVGAVVTKAK